MRTIEAQSSPGSGRALGISSAPPGVIELRPLSILQYLLKQPLWFWLVNFYLFIEYVRPQSIWTSLAVLPWGQIALLGALVTGIFSGQLFRRRSNIADLGMLFFSLVLVLSSLTALNPSASFEAWPLFFSWVLVYFLVSTLPTSESRFFIVILAFLLYSFKMAQHGFRSWAANGFAFRDWGATGAPGWFENSGEFGIQMCVFLPLGVEFILALRPVWSRPARVFMYLLPITAVGSIIASSSRGALVGGAAVGLWWVARSKHRVRAIFAVAAVAGVIWMLVPPESKARLAASGTDGTSVSRLERWEAGLEMAREHPVLGIGFNNWRYHYGPLSHNIFIEAVSELGYTGLAAFILLIVATFILNARSRRMLRKEHGKHSFLIHMAYGLDGALVGYLTSGFFVTVLYYPYFWVNLALTTALHATVQNTIARNRKRDAETHASNARQLTAS